MIGNKPALIHRIWTYLIISNHRKNAFICANLVNLMK